MTELMKKLQAGLAFGIPDAQIITDVLNEVRELQRNATRYQFIKDFAATKINRNDPWPFGYAISITSSCDNLDDAIDEEIRVAIDEHDGSDD